MKTLDKMTRKKIITNTSYWEEAINGWKNNKTTDKEIAKDIIDIVKEALTIPVSDQSEQLACDCDRQPLRYNELGSCKYCGKHKPSKG
jgi:hypothetical protein